ncbi:MAG: 5-deoxy-glucuronate isomerase [Acidimicrobiia bacterium]|nr:5-deoxy-glucuronate isomerase [bacterium]MXZ06030.1 5-deoxy-glucuronate isomerase [Acidimicrobiia bacterium]MYD04091.1 5-deoxy-glucuronate isomerase [Acidimicrobiia bacterium]MYF25992.1 5-deoxy-glucuronate isomerase [Acidimicrobiia bacterium]
MTSSLLKPESDGSVRLKVVPESAGWTYLDFRLVALEAAEQFHVAPEGREVAVVPIEGSGTVRVGRDDIDLSRSGVFDQIPSVLYVPPGQGLTVTARGRFLFTVGGAPAEGGLPVRLFEPSEMRVELRGGGSSYRQISHILAAPLPAERLILYEGHAPRGSWSGWAPHCHDGYAGSPYLEEVYYFRLQPSQGFAMHRNWREDKDFEEVLVCEDGDVALVPQGFHSTVACPGTNMYFLNYLAGELVGEERARGPYFHPDHTWIHEDWSDGVLPLPTPGASEGDFRQ